jgi:hypothetical protein
MCDFYEHAASVIIWLRMAGFGEDQDVIAALFDLVRRYGHQSKTYSTSLTMNDCVARDP